MKDYSGTKFNLLTIKKLAYINEKGESYWYCDCDCGTKDVIKKLRYLQNGSTKSCGCLRTKNAVKQSKIASDNRYNHGIYSYKDMPYGKKLHNVFNNMKNRCNNKKDKHYEWYGEKGVKVCDEWLNEENGFINFYNWAISNGYEEGLTIDREDVNGNYEPFNCRWITMKEQNNNMTTNHKITINGETKNISQFADEYNINAKVIGSRLKNGKSDKELIEPIKTILDLEVTKNNITKTLREWVKEKEDLSEELVKHRYQRGDKGERLIRDKEYKDRSKLTINDIYETIENEIHTLTEWADKYNIKHETIRDRYKKGWRGKDLIKEGYNNVKRNKVSKDKNIHMLEN